MKFILINGKKRSGKDYFARVLKSELYNMGLKAEIMSYADPIKEIIATTFGISLRELDDYKNKCSAIMVNDLIISDFRSVIQHFGTEAMKKQFGEDVWVNLLRQKADNSDADYIIIPDFRFKIENIGGITVKIRNDDIDKACTDMHKSENELNDFSFDYTINNTGYRDINPDAVKFIKEILGS